MSETQTTPGARKLREWIAGPPKRTQVELVDLLAKHDVDTTQQAVSTWLSGENVPDDDKFPALTKITGIKQIEFWDPQRVKKLRRELSGPPEAA